MYTPGCTFLGTTLNSIYDGSDCAISRYNKPVHHSSKRGGNVLIRSTSTVRGGRLCLSWHHMVSHDVSTHELLDDRSHHHDKRSLRLQASTPPVAPTAAAPSTICTDHGSQNKNKQALLAWGPFTASYPLYLDQISNAQTNRKGPNNADVFPGSARRNNIIRGVHPNAALSTLNPPNTLFIVTKPKGPTSLESRPKRATCQSRDLLLTFPVAMIPAGRRVARLEGAFPQQPLGRDQLGGEVYVKPEGPGVRNCRLWV